MTRKKVVDVAEIIEWSPEKEIEKGLVCRRQEGIPMYVARFAKMPLRWKGTPAFMMKCWGGKGPEITTYFYNVPEEEIKDINENVGDWNRRLEKFGTEEQKIENRKYGIYLKGFKLPRIIIK